MEDLVIASMMIFIEWLMSEQATSHRQRENCSLHKSTQELMANGNAT